MKKLRFIGLIIVSAVLISSCNFSSSEEDCPFMTKKEAEKWHSELTKAPYEIYQNFDDTPFPKSYIDIITKDPENKHLQVHLGYSEDGKQNYFLFTIIGIGKDITNLDLDYSTLKYYNTENWNWEDTNKEIFEATKKGWENLVSKEGLLPTLSFTCPTVDIIYCPHDKFDHLMFGINTDAESKDYMLRIIFHEIKIEGEENDDEDIKYFDTFKPCPPYC